MMATTVEHVMHIPIIISYLAFPLLIYWGNDLLIYQTVKELRWQLRLCAIWYLSFQFNEMTFNLPTGYAHGQNIAMSTAWMSPYIAFTLFRFHFLPARLGGKNSTFTASGSLYDGLHERNAKKRAPLHHRLKHIILDCSVYVHILYVMYASGSVIVDFLRAYRIAIESSRYFPALQHLLLHSMLPPAPLLTLGISFLVPVSYSFWPPTVPEREELLQRDPKTLVARPKPKVFEQKWTALTLLREIQLTFIICYATMILVGTFQY
jgi:hypothetical protein